MDEPARLQTVDFPLLRRARALWTEGHLDAALTQFEQALAIQPDNVRALVESARAFGQRYEIVRAESLLQRATELAGDDAQVAALIAQSYRVVHRPYQAIETLEQIRRAKRLPLPLLGELAVLYEQTNQLNAARDAIESCMAGAPEQAEPQLILARIERVQGNTAAARSLLERLLARPEAAPLLRVRVWAELCYLNDAIGEYDAAVAAIEKAKQVLRHSSQGQQLSNRTAAINESFRRLYNELDAETMDQWRGLHLPADSRCAGIAHLLSFPRSGTTLLEQLLDAHPQIVSSPERSVFSKEIFPAMLQAGNSYSLSFSALQAIPRDRLETQRSRYLDYHEALLGEPLAGQVHLDKNPNHTSLIAGLFRLFPESRFLFAVRDPRDVMVSSYLRFFPLTEFSVAFLTWETTCQQYEHEINVWLSVRDKLGDQALELRYEDLVDEPWRQVRRALTLLGLEWDDGIADYRHRIQAKVINSPTQTAVRQPIYRTAVGRWKNYQRHLEPYLDRLEPFCHAFGYA